VSAETQAILDRLAAMDAKVQAIIVSIDDTTRIAAGAGR
jgi:hypothetical protein